MPTRKSPSLRHDLRVAAFVVLSIVSVTSDTVGQSPAASHPTSSSANGRFLGTRSCAAVACHGDAEAPGIAGQEFVYWLENDPHGHANLSLYSVLGQRMIKALGVKEGDRGYQNCQACHDPYVNQPAVPASPRISEAVGCEACHGPSSNWVADHYKPDWRLRSAGQKFRCGVIDTQSLVARGATLRHLSCRCGRP